MKIISSKFKSEETFQKPTYPKKIVCEYCDSELEYDESDIYHGEFGMGFLKCPCCGKENVLDDEDNIQLTIDNVEFPTHFRHTSIETGAIDVSPEEIEKFLKQAITFFENHKDEFSYTTEYGTMCMCVFRYDGDELYHVVVAKDYYETELDFRAEDYV